MKNLIVAYDTHYGIGAKNDLLWHLPADARYFKETTTGHAIIMGRKTYESIGRPLPNRQTIVVSRKPVTIPGATVVATLAAAYKAVEAGRDTFVVGGGEIYTLALPDIDRIYATEVGATFDVADIFFPALEASEWREVSRIHHSADEKNLYDFDFVIYDRH